MRDVGALGATLKVDLNYFIFMAVSTTSTHDVATYAHWLQREEYYGSKYIQARIP